MGRTGCQLVAGVGCLGFLPWYFELQEGMSLTQSLQADEVEKLRQQAGTGDLSLLAQFWWAASCGMQAGVALSRAAAGGELLAALQDVAPESEAQEAQDTLLAVREKVGQLFSSFFFGILLGRRRAR